MLWLYVIAAIAGIATFLWIALPRLTQAAKVVEVPQLIPMPQMPTLPTEIKVSLPEITFPEIPAFPEITFPEIPAFPDFEKIVNTIMDRLPSTEDFKKDIIDPFVKKIPSVDDITTIIEEKMPKWIKDPAGYFHEKRVLEHISPIPTGREVGEWATGAGQAYDQWVTGVGEIIGGIKLPTYAWRLGG